MNFSSQSRDTATPAHDRVQLIRMGVRVSASDYVVALAGNPNTGKSTVFNSLTGLRQHTGNWPGKTVTRAEGGFVYGGRSYKMVDLPGTYSLLATSVDEEIARDFLLFGRPDVTVVVVDACRLERNLNLALQVLEITDRVVVCLNLMDEARRKHIRIDANALARELGVPVTPAAARYREGIDDLLESIDAVATGRTQSVPRRLAGPSFPVKQVVDELSQTVEDAFPALPNARWVSLRLLDNDQRITEAVSTGELGDLTSKKVVEEDRAEPASALATAADPQRAKAVLDKANSLRWRAGPDFHQRLVEGIYVEAAAIADRVVTRDTGKPPTDWDRKLDWLLTNRWTGFPIMILMLAMVLWLTVAGANAPSAVLAWLLLDTLHPLLKSGAEAIHMPLWLDGLLLDGVYLATAWVIAVMLPPMAIFFPLFTLLEDFGYLPRVAFNLDKTFRRCGAHGKQALTMCMGFGCNAAGVIATRVIDSPRERLLAIITNNFSLCNGRWPTQILIATIFLGALVPTYLSGFVSAAAVVAIALLGIAATFATSWLLSRTLLRGEPSSFHLELPPYRPPRILQTLYTSLIDRTIIVLWRAILFAVPAGAAIWLLSNIQVGGWSLAEWSISYLDPVGILIGLNGVILLAYIVAIPANEIVIPTVLMLTVLTTRLDGYGAGTGVMFESDSTNEMAFLLREGGWTVLTAVNLMLFSLLHNPCSTTIFTIWKETRSTRWTIVATMLPVLFGFVICYLVAQVWRLIESW
jgi:ferrous iron transport protein B